MPKPVAISKSPPVFVGVVIEAMNGRGKALLEGKDSGGLPSPDDGVDDRVDVGKFLAAAYGQLVDEAGYEPLADIEVGASVVRSRVVVVEEAIPSLRFRAGAGGGGLVVKALRPGIDAGERETGWRDAQA